MTKTSKDRRITTQQRIHWSHPPRRLLENTLPKHAHGKQSKTYRTACPVTASSEEIWAPDWGDVKAGLGFEPAGAVVLLSDKSVPFCFANTNGLATVYTLLATMSGSLFFLLGVAGCVAAPPSLGRELELCGMTSSLSVALTKVTDDLLRRGNTFFFVALSENLIMDSFARGGGATGTYRSLASDITMDNSSCTSGSY
mmetsp:Transcript_10678/g.28278  ORF Transcript_10678/g.28278 Transcript_10678/m.28278 type:complete len:198 (+) Transcript_10678:31-624(+)